MAIRVYARSLSGSCHWLIGTVEGGVKSISGIGGGSPGEAVPFRSIEQAIKHLTTGKLEDTWQILEIEDARRL